MNNFIKIKEILLDSIFSVIKILLLSIAFVFLFLPVFIHLEPIKRFLMETNKDLFIGFTVLILLFLVCFWPKAQDLCRRYKNLYKLKNPPFTHLAGIVLFIILSSLIAYFHIKAISLSSEFRYFAVFNIASIIVWFFSSYFWNKKPKEMKIRQPDTTIYSLSDAPIESMEQDLLGREQFINVLCNEIIEYGKNFSDSFVFGLYASWGEGKTSVLNLLKKKIEENEKTIKDEVKENKENKKNKENKENKQIIIVDFNPWYFKNEEAILTAFYEQLEQAISKEFLLPDIKRLFKRYKGLIATGLSKTEISLDSSFMDESLQDVKDEIEKKIEYINKKIIIFIDDIDRLTPKEVLLIFKLVRLNSGFKNTIFILSFDPAIVNESLENISIQSSFLDKIVQKPIHLPKIEQIYIDNCLHIYIDGMIHKALLLNIIDKYSPEDWKKIFVDFENGYLKFKRDITEENFNFITDEEHKKRILFLWRLSKDNLFDRIRVDEKDRQVFEKNFPYIYQTQIRKLFKSLRDVKRFMNSIKITPPAIYTEINLFDFFVLEIIKMFYPKVFRDIWENPWNYIPVHWSDKFYILSPYLSLRFYGSEGDRKKYERIKQHIEDVIHKEKNPEVLEGLLKKIFPVEVENALSGRNVDYSNESLNYRNERKITHPDCFMKYFSLEISPLELSDSYIKETLNIWNSQSGEGMEDIIEKTILEFHREYRLLDFLSKLRIFVPSMVEIKETVVVTILRVLYKNVHKFKPSSSPLEKTEYSKIKELSLFLIDTKVAQNKMQHIVEEIIMNTTSIFFACDIELNCRYEEIYPNISKIINKERLCIKLIERLEKYFVQDKRNIFDDFPAESDSRMILLSWEDCSDDTNVVKNYIFSLIENNAKNFVKFLLCKGIEKRFNTANLDRLNRIYNINELRKLAKKFKDDSSLSDKEREAIGEFLSFLGPKEGE